MSVLLLAHDISQETIRLTPYILHQKSCMPKPPFMPACSSLKCGMIAYMAVHTIILQSKIMPLEIVKLLYSKFFRNLKVKYIAWKTAM